MEPLGLEGEAAVDLRAHGLGRGDGGVPEAPELAVGGSGDEGVVVRVRERDELDVLAGEGDWGEWGKWREAGLGSRG